MKARYAAEDEDRKRKENMTEKEIMELATDDYVTSCDT